MSKSEKKPKREVRKRADEKELERRRDLENCLRTIRLVVEQLSRVPVLLNGDVFRYYINMLWIMRDDLTVLHSDLVIPDGVRSIESYIEVMHQRKEGEDAHGFSN